ncbi:hypothetical protein [Janthinobacterium sp. CAN_S7]|uniref:hypothetical protein n=1 Tax=Janthinobacterium sp. CAN_S7 TaxID=3071704 RepID=UPI00319E77EB
MNRVPFEELAVDIRARIQGVFVGARRGDGALYAVDAEGRVSRFKNRPLDAEFLAKCNEMIAAGESRKAIATYRLATNCSEKSARFDLNL